MKRLTTLTLAAALCATLCACSDAATDTTKAAATAAKPAADPVASLASVATDAKGFTVGSLMSAQTVYVFFDPQCPHCGHLWQASLPLLSQAKFVWIPVGLLNRASTTQAAALLAAADPLKAMTEHEASLLARSGGISASSDVPDATKAVIEKNTALLRSMGVESIPFIIAKNPKTGKVVGQAGAGDTAALAELVGLTAPLTAAAPAKP